MQRDIWVIDIEASGLSPASYPIEVAIVNGDQEYQALIIPADSWTHWSLKAAALHGISRHDLENSGKPARRVARELNRILEGKTVYSDHSDWDGFWLQKLFEHAGIEQTFVLMDITTRLEGFQQDQFVDALQTLTQSASHRAHRALDDARVIHRAITLAEVNGGVIDTV